MSSQPFALDREAFIVKRAAEQAEDKAYQRQLTNRRNALQSTGPRTAEGKAASSKNRLAHGLCSSSLLVGDESREDFDALRTEFLNAYQPATPEERMLTDQLVEAQWRLNRARRVEAKTQDFLIYESFEILSNGAESVAFASDQLHVASFLLQNNETILRNVQRYVAAIERSHQRALKNLHHAQEKRRTLPPHPAPVETIIEKTKAKAATADHPLPEIGFESKISPATPRHTPEYANRS